MFSLPPASFHHVRLPDEQRRQFHTHNAPVVYLQQTMMQMCAENKW